jgi:hypothetical protein
MDILEIKNKLSTIIVDCEYREAHSISGIPYICAYDGLNDISVRISFGKSTQFEIEYLGNNMMKRYVNECSDSDVDTYLFILKDLVDHCNKFRDQVNKFPLMSEEDRSRHTRNNRGNKIEKIFQN